MRYNFPMLTTEFARGRADAERLYALKEKPEPNLLDRLSDSLHR